VGAKDVTLGALGEHAVLTQAEAGAAGGVAITPAAALLISSNRTAAQQEAGSTVQASGDVELSAAQSAVADTQATGQAEGEKAAIGAAIGVAVVSDEVQAHLAGHVNAGGDVSVDAQGASSSSITATAGARGAKGDDSSDSGGGGSSVDDQIAQKLGFGTKVQQDKGVGDSKQRNATKAEADAQKNDGKGSASTSEGQVSVAAAVAVNVQSAVVRAELASGSVVHAGGKTRLSASHNTDAMLDADGRVAGVDGAESNADIGIGAAVSVNVVSTRADALINNGAQLTAK